MRICQKIYNGDIITHNSKCLVRNSLYQTLLHVSTLGNTWKYWNSITDWPDQKYQRSNAMITLLSILSVNRSPTMDFLRGPFNSIFEGSPPLSFKSSSKICETIMVWFGSLSLFHLLYAEVFCSVLTEISVRITTENYWVKQMKQALNTILVTGSKFQQINTRINL